jgi:MFS family permease
MRLPPIVRGGLGRLERLERFPVGMLLVGAAVFLTALDQTVVVTALPQIIADLQIPVLQVDRAAWIISGYLLGYVIAMPLLGRLSDLYGRKRLLLICLAVFALASYGCGLAPWLGQQNDLSLLQPLGIDTQTPGLVWLVAARIVQAAGGGAILPVAMALAGDYYGERALGPALGLIGMVTEAGGVLGPLYGAWITQTLGWNYIFFLNLPIVAILLLLIALFLKERPGQAALAARSGTIDLAGSCLLGAVLVCLSLGLSQEAVLLTGGSSLRLTGAPVQNNPWLLLAALLFLALFVWLEHALARRRPDGRAEEALGVRRNRLRLLRRLSGAGQPLIDLALFRRLTFVATALVSLLVGAALISAMVDIPIFVATVLGRPAIDSGLALLRLTAMIPVGALVGGWLCSRLGCRWIAVLGLLCTALGFWLMHLWPLQVDWTEITISTLIAGLGFGLVIAPIGVTALNSAGAGRAGLAAALVTMLRMVGMILGLAALTSWGLGYFRALAAAFVPPRGVPPLSAAYLQAYAAYLVRAAHSVYTAIFLVAGLLSLLAILPALCFTGKEPPGPLERSTREKNVFAADAQEQPAPAYEGEMRTGHEQR